MMTDEQALAWFENHARSRSGRLMTHDWPECGPGTIDVEELYQAIKMRLMSELVTEWKKP
jgi:hypothetical protein